MAAPQMTALDQALAELEIPQPDPGRWAGQLAEAARQMRAVIGRRRDLVPSSFGFLPGADARCAVTSACWPSCGPVACRTARRSPGCICCGSS